MRRIAKFVALILVLSMFSTCVYATDTTLTGGNEGGTQTEISLATPTITEITVKNNNVIVSFDVVEGATKYVINYETAGIETETEALATPTTIEGLAYKTAYNIKVKAVQEAEAGTIESQWSEVKSATIGKPVLVAPKLSITEYNKGATLKWNAVEGADSYEIYRKYSGKWSKIKTVTATKYTNKKLKVGKKYYYRIKAVVTVDGEKIVSSYSNTKSITANTYLTGDIKKGYSTGKLWKASRIYKEGSSKTKIGTKKIAAGTNITIIDRQKVNGITMAYVKVKGKKYWIRNYNITDYAPYTTKDYTTEAKENFVNKNGYSSKSKYLLFISCYAQRVYIFKGSKGDWELYKSYRCCTGKGDTRTPQGVFTVKKKAAKGWCYKYVTYFQDRNSFHTRPYGTTTMGRPASNGCIRLYDDAAKFIYKNVPKGTTVVSY